MITDNCNSNADSSTFSFGNRSINDTRLDGSIFFTGSPTFQVKEIEVFEIIDSQAGPILLLGIGTRHNLALPPRRLELRVFWDFPAIFDEFREKQFILLWRGSGDGFHENDFQGRCDSHSNTLTVILDTNGNIIGGFTPVEWESREWNGKRGMKNNCNLADPRMKGFIFTLKNPHNVPARKSPLKANKKDEAI
jgi:hypothetical protein